MNVSVYHCQGKSSWGCCEGPALIQDQDQACTAAHHRGAGPRQHHSVPAVSGPSHSIPFRDRYCMCTYVSSLSLRKPLGCSLREKGLARTFVQSALLENAERLIRFACNAFLPLLPPIRGKNSSVCQEVLLNFLSRGKQQCLSLFLRSQ